MSQDKPDLVRNIKFFLIGGVSGATASSLVHPADTLKVRCQIVSETTGAKGHRQVLSPVTVARMMYKEYGIISFYKGIDSSVMRQLIYTSTRLGVYKSLFDMKSRETGKVDFSWKLVFALFAGFCGACVGNPFELSMVRRQADLTLPIDQRRNYRNAFQAIHHIVKHDGIATLWRGVPFTILRVMALTSGQFTTFDEVKERTRKFRGGKDDIYNRVVAASCSGFVSSVTALPFDNVKVKFQKMMPNPDGSMPYSSLKDTFVKTYKLEGVRGFWTGFPAFYLLVGPHTFITLVVNDYLNLYANKSQQK